MEDRDRQRLKCSQAEGRNSSSQQHMRGLQADAKPGEVTVRMDIGEQKKEVEHSAAETNFRRAKSSKTQPVAATHDLRSNWRVP